MIIEEKEITNQNDEPLIYTVADLADAVAEAIAKEREACARLAEEQFEPEVWQRLEQAWQNGYNAGREAEREAGARGRT